MRLIDADALLANMDKGMQGTAREYLKFHQMAVNDEPTAYDVDKVIEQIKETKICGKCLNNRNTTAVCAEFCNVGKELEIIKSGGVR